MAGAVAIRWDGNPPRGSEGPGFSPMRPVYRRGRRREGWWTDVMARGVRASEPVGDGGWALGGGRGGIGPCCIGARGGVTGLTCCCTGASSPRGRAPACPPGANHRGRLRCAAGGRQIVRRSASTPVVTSPARVQVFMPVVLGRVLCSAAHSALSSDHSDPRQAAKRVMGAVPVGGR